VHLFGLPAGLAAAAWLILTIGLPAAPKVGASLLVYCFGLVGMLGASAAYHLARPGRTKERLRRLDHAMIFVMIAGTYTPFALNVLPGRQGILLCAAAWAVAAAGIALKLFYPRRLERLSLMLYLGMGWMVLSVMPSLVARTTLDVLMLLVLGGVVYSVGSVIHSLRRVRFQNAIWHLLVLLGAGLHLAAVTLQFTSPA
jgi:hemolysin III